MTPTSRASACSCASTSTCRWRTARSPTSPRIERVAPTINEIADKGGKVILLSHFGRPKGRDAKESLRPVAAELARALGRPVAFADDCIGEPREGRGRRDEAGRHPAAGEHALPHGRGEERSGLRRRAREARRPLCQRRASRPRIARTPRPRGSATCCRPMPGRTHAGRARRAGQGAGSAAAPGRRDRRRRQGLDQARAARQTSSPRSTCWSSAAAWPTPSCWRRASQSASRSPSTTCADTAREILAKAKASGCEIVLPVDAVVAQKFEANAPSRVVRGRRSVGADDMILDIGPQQHRARQDADAGARRRPWSGTARSAPSRCSRSTPGTVEVARGGRGTHQGRQARLGRGRRRHGRGAQRRRRRGAIYLCVDRRRRLPGMDGGQGACRVWRY